VGKVIFWIVVVFVVLFALRLIGIAKAKRRAAAARRDANSKAASANQAMVRCTRCGVYLPRGEATPLPNGFSCGDAKCLQSR
jgi:hypothetical protein